MSGIWKKHDGTGYIWLAGYFSEDIDAWWCVGRGKTLYKAVGHLKRQLRHRDSNEKRLNYEETEEI